MNGDLRAVKRRDKNSCTFPEIPCPFTEEECTTFAMARVLEGIFAQHPFHSVEWGKEGKAHPTQWGKCTYSYRGHKKFATTSNDPNNFPPRCLICTVSKTAFNYPSCPESSCIGGGMPGYFCLCTVLQLLVRYIPRRRAL